MTDRMKKWLNWAAAAVLAVALPVGIELYANQKAAANREPAEIQLDLSRFKAGTAAVEDEYAQELEEDEWGEWWQLSSP